MKKQDRLPRGAGILLPVSSLPSPCGIGTLGEAAYRFVDFLRRAGQRYWQVLPIGPTSYGDSPYQSFSAFAGNPYFIDLDTLVRDGLLTPSDLAGFDWGEETESVDYALLYQNRFHVLRAALHNFSESGGYRRFCDANRDWLDDYALFMALKDRYGGMSWQDWPDEPLRMRDAAALKKARSGLAGDIEFWRFCQYLFYEQWDALRAYAAQNGVSIIGDIPIYVSLDSADVWASPRQFCLDEGGRPREVAGVPPDMFSQTGQLWGNPLYDWQAMEDDGFAWWKKRMAFSASIYDIIRIDHFIGIVRYYAIPANEQTAEHGKWKRGPGAKLIDAISGSLNGAAIIAEDLGLAVPSVLRLRDRAGYPGMKLLELAFDSGPDNRNLPHHFSPNCVVYGGTHDNETLPGYCRTMRGDELDYARQYLNVRRSGGLPDAIIRAGYASVADTVIFQMQDYLGLDNRARMNRPSTLGGNWQWRLAPGQLDGRLVDELRELAVTYGRCIPDGPAGRNPETDHATRTPDRTIHKKETSQ